MEFRSEKKINILHTDSVLRYAYNKLIQITDILT